MYNANIQSCTYNFWKMLRIANDDSDINNTAKRH